MRMYDKARRFTDQEHSAPLWTAALEEASQRKSNGTRPLVWYVVANLMQIRCPLCLLY